MKKILALMLALAMLLSVCSVFAEDSGKTVIQYDEKLSFGFVVPESYALTSFVEDGIVMVSMISDDQAKVNYLVVIGQDPEHDELPRLNDLDAAAKEQFVSDLIEDLNNPTYAVQETGFGTEVVVINEQDAEYDMVTLTTLYYGCIISIYVGHNDGAEVTEAEVADAMQVMTDLEFIVAE